MSNAALQPRRLTPGHYVIVDPDGRLVRVTPIITSWAAKVYQVQPNGVTLKAIN